MTMTEAEPDIAEIVRALRRVAGDDPALRGVATVLACLAIYPPSQRRRKRTRGRPAKPAAAYAADIVMTGIEIATGARADLPISPFNARPRGLEPVVREVLALLGIVANPRAAIHAALAMRVQRRASGRRRPFLERGTGAAMRRINMNAAMPVPVGPTVPHDRATTH